MKIKNIFNQIKKIQMTEQEKSGMRIYLAKISGTNLSKLTAQPSLHQYRTGRPSPFHTWSFASNFKTVGLAVLSLLVASTGVTFAAEKTLPGDLLYSVKVNVTEEVRGALISTNKGKMVWEKERVVRRVEETETLLKTNKFTPARQAEAETALKTQMETFATAAAKTSVADPNAVIAATAELEPALKVHQEVIATIASNVDTKGDAGTILSTVALGITAANEQESVAIDVAADKNPDTIAALADEKISGAAFAIDDSISAGDSVSTTESQETDTDSASAVVTSDEKNLTDTESIITLNTKTDTKPEPESKPSSKELIPDTSIKSSDDIKKTITTNEVVVDTATGSPISLLSAIETSVPAPIDPKVLLSNAKAKLLQAKALRDKGDFKAALVVAQDAYKDMVAIKVQAKIIKKDATPSKTTPSRGEVKGVKTESKSDDKIVKPVPTIETPAAPETVATGTSTAPILKKTLENQ